MVVDGFIVVVFGAFDHDPCTFCMMFFVCQVLALWPSIRCKLMLWSIITRATAINLADFLVLLTTLTDTPGGRQSPEVQFTLTDTPGGRRRLGAAMWGVFAVLASAILIFCKALGLAVKFALEFVDLIFGTDFEVESAKFNMYRGYVEIRTADGVDLNFVKGRGLGLSNVKAMLGYMEADLPRASVLAQVVPQSALDANDIEGSSIPSDFQPRLGHVKMTSMLRSPTPLQSICHRSRARNSTCVEVM